MGIIAYNSIILVSYLSSIFHFFLIPATFRFVWRWSSCHSRSPSSYMYPFHPLKLKVFTNNWLVFKTSEMEGSCRHMEWEIEGGVD